MIEFFKDFLAATQERIKSPVFGFIFGSVLVANWDKLFFLIASDASASVRIRYVSLNTNLFLDVLFPVIFGAFLCAAYPWVVLGFSQLSRNPVERLRIAQLKSLSFVSHERLLDEIEYEKKRANLEKLKDNNLLERVQREDVLRGKGGQELVKEAERLRSTTAALERKDDTPQFSDIETGIIRILGYASKPASLGEVLNSEALVNAIKKSNRNAGVSRVSVLVTAALNALIQREIIQNHNTGYLLTKQGFDVFDKIAR